jgi:hypothetical protein
VRIDLGPEEMARCIDEAGSVSCSRRRCTRACATRRGRAVRSPSAPCSTCSARSPTPRAPNGSCSASTTPELVPVMAEVAGRLGAERVLVVHGHPGMDEVSASGPTTIGEFADGAVHVYEVTPEEVGIARGTLAGIAGGDDPENAAIVRAVLAGEHGQPRDVVLMNAAAALLAAGRVVDMAEGVALARESIDSGAALARLEALVAVSRRLAAEKEAVVSGFLDDMIARRTARVAEPSGAGSRPPTASAWRAAPARRATFAAVLSDRRMSPSSPRSRRHRPSAPGRSHRSARPPSRRCTTRTAARRPSACSPSPRCSAVRSPTSPTSPTPSRCRCSARTSWSTRCSSSWRAVTGRTRCCSW